MSECSVRNLQRLKSDHNLVLVSLQSKKCKGDGPFHGVASWFYHGNFRNMVASTWNIEGSMVEDLESAKTKLAEWNK